MIPESLQLPEGNFDPIGTGEIIPLPETGDSEDDKPNTEGHDDE